MIVNAVNARSSCFAALAMAIVVVAGPSAAQRAGQSLSIQTGRVIAAQPVELDSNAGRGALLGGIVGYATTSSGRSRSRRARNTILGAAGGAALAGAAQGSRSAMQFTVELSPGSTIVVVTDQTEVRVGDCVNVEQAGSGTANVRRVSPYLCEAAAEDAVEPDIAAGMDRMADLCLQAKERLFDAETEDEIEAAVRRVHILCDD